MTIRIGIQLFSARTALKADPWGTLDAIGALGYRYVEAANHNALHDDGVGFGVSAAELSTRLAANDLAIVGCHVNPLDLDRLPAVLDYHAELGLTQIGCDIEFYPYGDRDYILRRSEQFNRVGALCAERGMRFYYHNHYQEFQELDGVTVYETILANTDPNLVFLELDTYWIARAGHDPIEWMRRYAERVVLMHQKDFPADAPQPLVMFNGVVDKNAAITQELFEQTKDPRCFTEIGTGILPIQTIIDAAQDLPNLEYILLEQDHSALPELESLRVSREAFSTFSGISWD